MWSAIIKAIDNAANRLSSGARSGIDVAAAVNNNGNTAQPAKSEQDEQQVVETEKLVSDDQLKTKTKNVLKNWGPKVKRYMSNASQSVQEAARIATGQSTGSFQPDTKNAIEDLQKYGKK